ncbi:InlB B-repeat-containing protein [Actinomycetota bacterium Odt1-20B]
MSWASAVACAVVLTQAAPVAAQGAPPPTGGAAARAAALGPVPGEPWVLREGRLGVTPDNVKSLCDQQADGVFSIVLPLFPDVTISAVADQVGYLPGDSIVIEGHVEGAPDAKLYLTVTKGCSGGPVRLSGQVQQGYLRYELTGTDEGYSAVQEIDPRAKPVRPTDTYTPPVIHREPAGTRARTARPEPRSEPRVRAQSVVDVAVGYTKNAAKKLGGDQGLKDKVAVAEKSMNAALKAAGVQGKVKFGSLFKADYTGNEDSDAVLKALNTKDSALGKQARKLREDKKADLVSVISDVPKPPAGTYTAGIANTPQEPLLKEKRERKGNTIWVTPPTSGEQIYSAVDAADMADGTMAHELGHNMALWHDDKTLDEQRGKGWAKNPVYPYNRGFVVPSQKYHSIMAYGSACTPAWSCSVSMHYSAPKQKAASGETLGNADHDNARVLRQTLPVVAQYRTPPKPPTTYALALSAAPAAGGTVKAAQDGPYDPGTKVTVTATPQAGYAFSGWTLDGKPRGSANPTSVLMDARHTLVAQFKKSTTPPKVYPVTATADPAQGGTVALKPSKSGYPQGAKVTATASPKPGYRFSAWELNGRRAGTDAALNLEVDGATRLTAKFSRADLTLTTKTAPNAKSGTLQVSEPGPYPKGSSVLVSARPAKGRKLTGWSVDGAEATPANPLRLTMDTSHTVTATFGCATSPKGGFAAKWRALGGGSGSLGCATTGERRTRGGSYERFAGGNLYRTGSAQPYAVHGPIFTKYGQLAYERGGLGFPVADAKDSAADTRQEFRGGTLVYDKKTHKVTVQRRCKLPVTGSFARKWQQLGGIQGVYGCPTTKERPASKGGVFQRFDYGNLYWTKATGPHGVQGPFLWTYEARGWERGRLGFPVGDERPTATGATQRFQGGTLTWNRRTGKVTG